MYKLNAAQALALNAVSTAVSNVHYNLRKVEDSTAATRSGLESGTHIPVTDTTAAVDLRVSAAMLGRTSNWASDMFPDMPEDEVAELLKKVRLYAFRNFRDDFLRYAEGSEV